jgi:hypothetical protein
MKTTDKLPFLEADGTRHFSLMLLKFGEQEYLKDLRDGWVFLKPQRAFCKVKNDTVREDKFETVDEMFQPKVVRSFSITHNGQTHRPRPSGPILINLGRREYNVFCMYSVPTSHVGGLKIDPRNFGFGDSFVVILNTQEFLDRVRQAAEKVGFIVDCNLIEYLDIGTYSGEVGPFRKPASFEYQREFRIIITPGAIDPVKLKICTLRDITTPIFPLAEINTSIEMNLKPLRQSTVQDNLIDGDRP